MRLSAWSLRDEGEGQGSRGGLAPAQQEEGGVLGGGGDGVLLGGGGRGALAALLAGAGLLLARGRGRGRGGGARGGGQGELVGGGRVELPAQQHLGGIHRRWWRGGLGGRALGDGAGTGDGLEPAHGLVLLAGGDQAEGGEQANEAPVHGAGSWGGRRGGSGSGAPRTLRQ
ncbi:hypothetical protein F0U63_10930 [Cystobacter fuscus]|nr:hypothetical protein F0U63_10930 [Cystobacter fuscus]